MNMNNTSQSKPTHSVFMHILDKQQIGRLQSAIHNTEFLLVELGESEDHLPPNPEHLIFMVTNLTFDNEGNLLGRVTPTGPHKEKGRDWISTHKYKEPIFKFIPHVTTNNRGWTFINKLDVVTK